MQGEGKSLRLSTLPWKRSTKFFLASVSKLAITITVESSRELCAHLKQDQAVIGEVEEENRKICLHHPHG